MGLCDDARGKFLRWNFWTWRGNIFFVGFDGNTGDEIAGGGRLDARFEYVEQSWSACDFFLRRGVCVACVVCDGVGANFGSVVGQLCCVANFGVLVMGGGERVDGNHGSGTLDEVGRLTSERVSAICAFRAVKAR